MGRAFTRQEHTDARSPSTGPLGQSRAELTAKRGAADSRSNALLFSSFDFGELLPRRSDVSVPVRTYAPCSNPLMVAYTGSSGQNRPSPHECFPFVPRRTLDPDKGAP